MRSQLPRTIRAALTVLMALCAAPHTARSDWTVATSAALSHDDNVGHGQRYADKFADSSAAASLSLIRLASFGEGLLLAAGGDASTQRYDRLTGLNNTSVDAVLSLKKKWGLGAYAPWTRAGISLGRADYDDGYRDATLYKATLEGGRRLDERWNLWAKFTFERRRADPAPSELYGISSNVFSLSGRNINAGVQYSLSERVTLSAGALLRRGGVVSTVHENAYLYVSARAVAADPSFGPDAYAYQLYGMTYGAKLVAEYAVTAHSLIGAGLQRLETHAQGGNNYTDSVPELTWNYRF